MSEIITPHRQCSSKNAPKPESSISADVLSDIKEAKSKYWKSNFQQALKFCEQILAKKPKHSDALAVKICCLVELQRSSVLFYLAHKLIDEQPESPVSWYAVGCYYYAIEQFESAKRYLAKCTGMTPAYGPGWVVFGHAFAAEREHDQAMNCYLKAAKVLPRTHLPLLYVGLEYSLTNNLRLGEKFLNEALKMQPEDPFILHELGVLLFRQQEYRRANDKFMNALDILTERDGDTERRDFEDALRDKLKRLTLAAWEPLVNNLGQCVRKLGRLEHAILFHRKALTLCARSASTFGSLGLCHLQLGHFDVAIEMFHRSLAIRNDDVMTKTLLEKTLTIYDQQLCVWDSDGSLEGALWTDVTVPRFTDCETNGLRARNAPAVVSKRVVPSVAQENVTSTATNTDDSTQADTSIDVDMDM